MIGGFPVYKLCLVAGGTLIRPNKCTRLSSRTGRILGQYRYQAGKNKNFRQVEYKPVPVVFISRWIISTGHIFVLLGGCPRIGVVARESHFESIFWSFEANSYSYSTKMSEIMGQNGFSAVDLLFSDSLLVEIKLFAATGMA